MTTWQEWSNALTERVAGAVKSRRTVLGLTAAELAERTSVGKPLTRAVISDLETGRKKSLEVTELLTLAVALEIPPILLLYPGFPYNKVELVPGEERASRYAATWFAGAEPGPSADAHANEATVLITVAVGDLENEKRKLMYAEIQASKAKGSPEFAEEIARLRNEVELAERHLELVRSKVWGGDA